MREKWRKSEKVKNEGNPIPQRMVYTEPMYQPKLLLKSPSLRAIKNYNDLSIKDDNNATQNSYDNLSFIPESEIDLQKYDAPYTISNASTYSSPSNSGDTLLMGPYDYDYANTIRSSSGRTSTGSDLDSEKQADMGSTVKLVPSKFEMSCQTWCVHLDTVLCTFSLAANLGNLYRLPQVTFIRGGLPFLIAYVILKLIVGFPLLFLELGIGQLAQEGFIKSWRAVPFFLGVGYVKLIAGCLLSIYYPLIMALFIYYLIWMCVETVPFPECSVIKRDENGYAVQGITGQKCLKKTFLTPPTEDPFWYVIFVATLFLIWILIVAMSSRRTKSYIRSLTLLLFPLLICYVAMMVKGIFVEHETGNLSKLVENVDWSSLYSANVWYYALVQVFFSTNVGFGSFVTNAGILYNKVNPLWTALGFTVINTILGIGVVILYTIFAGDLATQTESGDIAELHLMTVIYNVIKNGKNNAELWATCIYIGLLSAGLISMATMTYSLLKAITVQSRRRLKWWQTSIVLSFSGFILGSAVLICKDFSLVHLLDHYIVGNLILISVIAEVFAFIAFYGMERIRSDFEFMLGHILSQFWLILWWILPILMISILIWALVTLNLEGIFVDDPKWLYIAGWCVCLVAMVVIVVIGFLVVDNQDAYTSLDKFKLAFKPSKNWGPKDPILRYNWVQWNSKTKQGERDFTLKRRGTKEYTKSVKRNAKKKHALATNSDLSTTTASGEFLNKNDQTKNDIVHSSSSSSNNNYVEPYYVSQNNAVIRLNSINEYNRPLTVSSLVDAGRITNINPLARPHTFQGTQANVDNNSEGYGTFRKGPYIIGDQENVGHICHRRFSQEDATEL